MILDIIQWFERFSKVGKLQTAPLNHCDHTAVLHKLLNKVFYVSGR